MRMSALFATTLLALAAAPSTAQPTDGPTTNPALAKALAGRTAGKPISCVHLRDVQSTRIIDGTAIIYELGRKNWLVNMPAGGCSSLRSDRVLVTSTPTGDLCRGDIVRVIDTPGPIEFGSCGLGAFVPYTR
jgi:hypothetical protein